MASLLWTVLIICVAAPSVTGDDVALGGECTDGGDPCASPSEAVCDQTGHCKLKNSKACTGGNVDKCVAGAECVSGTCTCKGSTYVDDSAGGSGKCTTTDPDKFLSDCSQPGSTCSGGHLKCEANTVCVCDGAVVPNLTSGACVAPAKPVTTAQKSSNGPGGPTVPGVTTKTTQVTKTTLKPGTLYGKCQKSEDCSFDNAECDTSGDTFCKCKAGYYAKGGSSCATIPEGKFGANCTDDKDCKDENSKCKDTAQKGWETCDCEDPKDQGGVETGCVKQGEIGGSCSDNEDCKVGNTYCQPRGGNPSACQCKSPYHMSGKKCVKSGSAALTSVTSLVLVALFWASRHLQKE